MTETLMKLEVLKETYDTAELDLILEKLLSVTLNRYRARLQRYEQDLRLFEDKYNLDSQIFVERFEAGEMGDAMDFFEWSSLYALRQDLVQKIERLESVA